jgi:SSS family solute:Na+ symporter
MTAADCSVARTVKFGALVFIIFVPLQYAIQLQLLGGIWIIQTLPSVLSAFTRAGSIRGRC